MKKNIRKVHVDGEVWKWYVTPRKLFYDNEGDVVIFSPSKTRHVLLIPTVGTQSYDEDGQENGYAVGPGDVARAIRERIKRIVVI